MPPKRAAAAAKQEDDATDYTKLKVADLKAECKKRGLEITGKKQDLIDRLKQEEVQGTGGKKVHKSTNKLPYGLIHCNPYSYTVDCNSKTSISNKIVVRKFCAL